MSYIPENNIGGFLEISQQLIFLLNLKSMFSVIWGGTKTKDLVGYVKVNWKPSPQSSPKLTSTLFASYHMPEKGVFIRTYFCEGQVPDFPRRHMRIKMNSCPGIIIYAASQLYGTWAYT